MAKFCSGATALLILFAMMGASADARVLPSIRARVPPPAQPRAAGLPSDAELEAQGARIGVIRLDARDLFDVGAADEDTALARLGNRLHVQTRAATIEDLLLFKPGDPYRANLLEESARILRGTHYLRDAQVRPVAFHDDVVDVEVITQDVWTFNPGFAYGRKGGKDSSGFQLEELNFLGTGAQIGVGSKSNVDRDSRFAYYRDRQLGSSWWSLSANYADNSDGRLAAFALDHPFYSLGSRWAGGVVLRDERRSDARYDLSETIDHFGTHERRSALYLGRSIGSVGIWTRRLSLGLSFDDWAFGSAPGEAAPRLLPADRRLVYPWIRGEWIEDTFRTARNRDQIEKTEDYSFGWRASALVGYATEAFGSDRHAVMFAGNVSKGVDLSPRQSLRVAFGAGGRAEGGAIAGGLLEADVRHYFRQSTRRLLFMSLSSAVGANPDADQQILLGGDNGLRGYPLRYQSGKGRWQFTAEQRFFSDWYPWQLFNVGGAVFYDMGSTWGRDPLGTPSRGLLRDVGLGLRFGNSRSALANVLHVDVAFPLDGDSSTKGVQFLVETRKSF